MLNLKIIIRTLNFLLTTGTFYGKVNYYIQYKLIIKGNYLKEKGGKVYYFWLNQKGQWLTFLHITQGG